ncbi:MAG: hypothetical protein HN826_15610 [Methylococcales bacterium]|jgi:hypothetical protein|nr:hypothetical protein [Methylococcales bacterium]
MRVFYNSTWQVEWIYTTDFPGRHVPLVIVKNGKPGFVINQWIYWLLEEGITPSLLDERIRAVMHLYEFYNRTYSNRKPTHNESKNLIANFLDAKKYGSANLGWKATPNTSTLKKYLHSINSFDKWQTTFHGASRMNPAEEQFMSSWEIYHDFRRRSKWDPMLHLFPSRVHQKVQHAHTIKIEHSRFRLGKKIIPKAFPINRFVELIEKTSNPRDQMLLLLMGGGSLRGSETLHLYFSDVLGINKYGASKVRLDDPETGEMNWVHKGKNRTGTRAQYLSELYVNDQFKYTNPPLYKLTPRTQGKPGVDHAGFKGMTFSSGGESGITIDGQVIHWHEIFWCDPRFGIRFQKAYDEYVSQNFFNKSSQWPHHPYLFITLEKNNYGMPLKLGALRGVFNRALKRLGMEKSGLGKHSLRHMFGEYCASILNLSIEQTRTLMHHGSTLSTEQYYHLQSEDVRKAINKAIIENAGIKITDYMIMPNSECIQLPETWSK